MGGIDIIAPGFKISQRDLKVCLKALKSGGIEHSVREPLFSKRASLCSDSQDNRWGDLKRTLSSDHEVIWCLRGGYGSIHLLPFLRGFTPKKFKALVGFSDVTTLHYFFNTQWDWPSLHWKHLNSFLGPSGFGLRSFKKSLGDIYNKPYWTYKVRALNAKAQSIRTHRTRLLGGNLMTFQSLVGTGLKPPSLCSLFFEEVDEPVYKIDRILSHLKQAGWLKSVRSLFLGDFIHKDRGTQRSIQKYLKDYAQSLKIPVFGGLKMGHGLENQPLFLNTKTEIFKQKQGFTMINSNGFYGRFKK